MLTHVYPCNPFAAVRRPDCFKMQHNEHLAVIAQVRQELRTALRFLAARRGPIETPPMFLTKAETWALADDHQQLDLIRNQTLTCYNGVVGDGCGSCPACLLRQRGLQEYLADRDSVRRQLRDKLFA